jgi:5,10-methylenetetrahydromethanopterin reductase
MVARIGFATGYDPGLGIRDMAQLLADAEARGFELGFFSETIELMRDSVSAMASAGLATSRMHLGYTQIVRLRSPIVMAQTLASLDELSGERMVLAVGACTRSHAARHGLEEVDPVVSLTDWVAAIRSTLSGDPFPFEGASLGLPEARLGWTPPRRKVPLWIAATSRTGLQVAGRIGDGVLLNAVSSPEYSANAIAIVREAAEAAGRDWETFEVAKLVNCSVEDDHDRAIAAIRWEVASKFDPLQLPFNAGPKLRVGEPYIRAEDLPILERAYREGGKPGLGEALPVSYVEGMTASGTPEEVVRRVEEYREAGVGLPIIRPAASHQAARLIDLLAPAASKPTVPVPGILPRALDSE